MLTPEQVAPFLMHEEGFVRAHAAQYLVKAHDPSPVTADDVWRAIDQRGMLGGVRLVARLKYLRQTEESIRRTLAALASPETDKRVHHDLGEVIGFVDLDLVQGRGEELLAAPGLPAVWQALLSTRLIRSGLPVEPIWKELMDLGTEAEDGPADEVIVEAVIGELARRRDEGVLAEARQVVREGTPTDLREVYAVRLLGELRDASSVGTMVEKLKIDDDALPPAVVEALVRIGTVEVVEQVEQFAREADWSGRLYAGEVLERINRPESEAALWRVYEAEKDLDLASTLAEGLCLLSPGPERLAALRDRAAAGRFSTKGHDVETSILAAGIMVGYEPPEQRRWLERARRTEAKIEALYERAEGWSAGGDEAGRLPPAPGEFEVTMPIHREAPKVGRNDPCPCGSGKKHKKCCGKG